MPDAATGNAGGLLGTLYVRMTADTVELDKKMDDSEKKVVKSSEHMQKAAEGLKHTLELLGIAFGVVEIVEFVKHTIEGTNELKKFSDELGIGIDRLAGLKFAADKADIGDKFELGMRRFAESLREAQVQGSVMQHIFQDVLKVDPSQGIDKALDATAKKFSGWSDGVNKMGMAQELFGIRNARFVNLLNSGADGLEKSTRDLARITGMSYEEAAKKTEEYHDAMVTLHAAFTGLALTFLKNFLPSITDFVTLITNHMPMIHEYAEVIGTKLANAFTVLANDVIPKTSNAMHVLFMTMKGIVDLSKDSSVGLHFMGMKDALDKAQSDPAFLNNAIVNKGGFREEWIKRKAQLQASMQSVAGGGLKGVDTGDALMGDAEWAKIDQMINKTTGDVGKFTEAVKDAGKQTVENVEQLKKFYDELDKVVGANDAAGALDFAKKSGGLKTSIGDITGIQGDAKGSFKGQQETMEIDLQLKQIEKLRDSHFQITEEQNKRLTEMEKLYADKRKAIQMAEVQLRLHTASTMFGDLADITLAFAGKQSGIYKTMFAVSKAFAIAEATVKIAQGIAEAASVPWPLNLFAIASVVAATASIVSSIQAVQLNFGGGKAGGGPVSPDKVFMVGERGPEMFVPPGAGTIVPNNRLGGGSVRVVINNNTDVKPEVSERQEGDEKIVEILLRRVKDELASDAQNGTGKFVRTLEMSYPQLRRR